jgi:hypothetical protein
MKAQAERCLTILLLEVKSYSVERVYSLNCVSQDDYI